MNGAILWVTQVKGGLSMKKLRMIAALLIAVTMLGGCNKNGENNASETNSSDNSASVTAAAQKDEQKADEKSDKQTEDGEKLSDEKEEKKPDLKSITGEELDGVISKLYGAKGGNIFLREPTSKEVSVIDANHISVDMSALSVDLFRESTTQICGVDDNKEDFLKAVKAMEKFNDISGIESARSLIPDEGITVEIELDDKLVPTVKGYTYGYTVQQASFSGYICHNKDGSYNVIVDPAYMYGIPMPVDCDCKYEIGSDSILMDSISFIAKDIKFSGENDSFNYDGYVFARFNVSDLRVLYNRKGESFSVADSLKKVEILAENGAEALKTALSIEKFEAKNDGSAAVYQTLLDNMEMFMGEDIMGVNLIDLDFDGAPEVLVTKSVQDEIDDGTYECADVDIYSIKDGKLNLIDTLYNYKTNVYQTGNVIGLKTTDKLEKEWFTMSRKNVKTGKNQAVDYLFKLKNGKLEYTEVFRSETVSYKPESDVPEKTNYYFYGEKLEFDSYEGPHPYDSDDPWTYYSWNGINATFGEWELWGFIRAEYCKSIEQSFNLYSDWLSVFHKYEDCEKLTLNERTMKYKLAYLVDSFYYGEYNPAKMEYSYWFLGDYAKPVIYLYPEEKTDVSVKVELDGGALTCTYPDYRDGWNVTAYPDGTLIDKADGEEYYCLYWEGVGKSDWDMSKGFVVKREDTADFLRSKLKEIGLTPRESNEFIIYWLPELMKNECNLITFQTEQYEKNARLDIDPVPDSMLRIFMVYEPCSEDTEVEPQEFEAFERKGFTAVEWGGSRINAE